MQLWETGVHLTVLVVTRHSPQFVFLPLDINKALQFRVSGFQALLMVHVVYSSRNDRRLFDNSLSQLYTKSNVCRSIGALFDNRLVK